jgi:hypothetical protein
LLVLYHVFRRFLATLILLPLERLLSSGFQATTAAGATAMASFMIDGILPIVPTPFTPDGDLDYVALASHLKFAINAHVCGPLPVVAHVNHLSIAYVAETPRDLEHEGAAAAPFWTNRTRSASLL